MIHLALNYRWYHAIPVLGPWLFRRLVAARIVQALTAKVIAGEGLALLAPRDVGKEERN